MKARGSISLDNRDLKILKELQADSTVTYRTLSDRVALSPSACVARVKQLEEAGIITGYHASIAADRVRPTFIMVAEISLKSHDPEDLARFDALLRNTREVAEALRVIGHYDYIVRFSLANVADWQAFAHRVLEPENKVEKMICHVVMEELKPFKGYPISDP